MINHKLSSRKTTLHIVILSNSLYSAVKIATTSLNVYTVDDHEISCLLEDIPLPKTDVLWMHDSGSANDFDIDDGDHSFSGYSQTSTLKISSSELGTLKSSKAGHAFTCKITVGKKKTALQATQSMTIYNPSE